MEKKIIQSKATQSIDIEEAIRDVDLSIIIPVHNNANFTQSVVRDLMRLPAKYEIIVVDNASTDDTAFILNEFMNQQKPERARLITVGCPRNLGFGRANNKGYKHSVGKNILFLNNDVRIRGDFETWPEELIRLSREGYLVGANGGILDINFNFVRETQGLVESDHFYLSGWCLAASRETFDKLVLNHYRHDVTDVITDGRAWGPWNEKFFAYFEDGDLSWRAKDLGIPFDIVEVQAHHFGRVTGRQLGLHEMYKTSQATFKEIWADRLK